MFALLLAFAGASSSPACAKLTAGFEANERIFGMIHDMDTASLESDLRFQEAVGPSEQRVAIEEARLRGMGGVPRPRGSTGPNSAERVAKARSKIEQSEAKYKAEGDRITTLLIANKCTPPDHVTSSFTYSKKNPDAPK